MTMDSSYINYQMISRALSHSMEILGEETFPESALERVKAAQKDLQQALSFSLSK